MSTRRGRDDRGLTLPIVALLMSTLIIMVATAVDLGRQRSDRRLAQSGADVVALDMMRIIEGRTLDEVLIDPDTAVALSESASRNGFQNAVGFVVASTNPRITNIEWGEVPASGSTFDELDPAVPADLATVPTAVRITAERSTDYFFQPGDGEVTRLAIATEDKVASFEVGTRLVSVNTANATLLNQYLTAVLGSSTNVSLVGYQGLIGATIGLDALAAELGFGSADELAHAGFVDANDFYLASAEVMRDQGDTAGAEVFEAMAASADSNAEVAMGSLFEVEQGGDADAVNTGIDAFSLVTGSAYAINGTSTISIPSVAFTAPGLTTTALSLDITELPRRCWGCREGDSVSTRQSSFTLTTTLDEQLAPGVRVVGTIPLTVQLAGGTGSISDIGCSTLPETLTVGLAPRPITSSMTMDLQLRTFLLNQPIADVTGTAASVSTQGSSNGATFEHPDEFLPDVGSGTMVTANPTSLGLSGSAGVSAVNFNVIGLPLGQTVNNLATLLNNRLNPILAALDTFVVNQLSTQLGLNVGGADIGALNMTCRGIKLVG